jgi:hypothetical protein
MDEVLITEAKATHDEDFHEHLNMHRTRTFRGKEKNSFVHWYERRGKKADDSHDSLHGIMNYHGYEHKPDDKKPEHSVFHKEDEHKSSKVIGTIDNKGDVSMIAHHERFKKVDENINEAKTFGKTLRSIVPKKSKLPTGADSVLNSPAAPGERGEQKKLLGLRDILKVPDANGNPEGFATAKSPDKRPEGPDVGKKEPMHKIKEEVEPIDEISKKLAAKYLDKNGETYNKTVASGNRLKARNRGQGASLATKKLLNINVKVPTNEEVEPIDELSIGTLKSYYKKAGKSAEKHYDKAGKEEDKAMSTDGNKYPEKQARHNATAQGHIRNYRNRVQGAARAHAQLDKGKK